MNNDVTAQTVTPDTYNDTLFTGALYFYSKGDDSAVTLDWDFSHDFSSDDMPAPASLRLLRDVWQFLRVQSQDAAVPAEAVEGLSDEDRVLALLDGTAEATSKTLH